MKAMKIEFIMEDNKDAEYFITQVLPEIKKKYGMKQVLYHSYEYFEVE